MPNGLPHAIFTKAWTLGVGRPLPCLVPQKRTDPATAKEREGRGEQHHAQQISLACEDVELLFSGVASPGWILYLHVPGATFCGLIEKEAQERWRKKECGAEERRDTTVNTNPGLPGLSEGRKRLWGLAVWVELGMDSGGGPVTSREGSGRYHTYTQQAPNAEEWASSLQKVMLSPCSLPGLSTIDTMGYEPRYNTQWREAKWAMRGHLTLESQPTTKPLAASMCTDRSPAPGTTSFEYRGLRLSSRR
ncbi:hypothetical protein DFP73DRAFT_524839 [Morchella snyderi]|nr:hypothetical protein DFP73DRAFT_524839 [Morchella snyderi]